MKAEAALVSAALGVGTLLLPGSALADTAASPTVTPGGGTVASPTTTPAGGTVVLTATTCDPASGEASFRVTGPDRDRSVRATTAAAGGGQSAELPTAGFAPGTYTVAATCGDGGAVGSVTFTVTPADGRYGGTGALAAGGVLLGSAAGGALMLARRRRHMAAATL
ncbi:hypothetical protein ACGFIG_26950 [Micromonospora sp. NPDC049048]|uniref:hypothetical protein n=1 Tax=Micromonospora sp. NPDC049048 TaxID=3364263 RepID=UPI00371555D5